MLELKSWLGLGEFYGNGDGGNSPPPEPPKTFTQDEVNSLLAEHKRGLQKQLDDLKKAGDPAALKGKIKELSDSLLTKEQLAKQEIEEAKAKYDAELQAASQAANSWKGMFEGTVKKSAIATAANKHNAFDAEQLELLIGPQTSVVEVTDKDGKGTGQYKTVTKIEIDGKTFELPTVDAVGKLRDANRYPNQFRVQGQSGTGSTTLNNAPPQAPSGVPKDMASFVTQFADVIKGK